MRGGRGDAGTRRDAKGRDLRFFEKKLGKKLSDNNSYWCLADLRGQTWGEMDFWLSCDRTPWTEMGLGGFG